MKVTVPVKLAAVMLSLAMGWKCFAAAPAAPAHSGFSIYGLVGYWPCDEGQGNVAANLMGENGDMFGSTGDASLSVGGGARGRGARGAGVVGAPAPAPSLEWGKGRFGQAIHLTGAALNVQLMEQLHLADAVTVSAWIKLDEVKANALIFTREQAYRLGLDNGGQGHVRWQLDVGGQWAGNWLLGKTAMKTGQWYNVTAVYDGKERRVYLDGQLDGRMPTQGMIALGTKMMMGQGFSGMIDEVRVWNRALSQEEIAQAMAAGAAQVRAVMRPSERLHYYPVRGIGMQANVESAEVAVFNSASAPFNSAVSVALINAAGRAVAAENQQLSIASRGSTRVRLAYKSTEPGMDALVVRTEGREIYRMPVYVLAPHPRQAAGALKLEKVLTVDLSKELGPEEICEDSSCKVVDSPIGRYREAGPQRGARFAARLTLPHLGLYLVRVSYPDDRERTCEVAITSPNEKDVYNAQTGYLTGAEYPNTRRMQTLDCVLWPRDVHQAILFTTKTEGQPAAATSVEVYEVTGGLPASPVAGTTGTRQVGIYYEDANPFPSCLGQQSSGIAEFDQAMCHLCDLMDYTGQNVLYHPGVWYDGPLYNCLAEQSGTSGGHDFPHSTWIDIILKRFEERGFKFYPTLNVHGLHSLAAASNRDSKQVKAGEPTVNDVLNDGTVKSNTSHGQLPAYNAIHPAVEARVLAIVQEMADRFGASPALGGVAFHMTRCTLLQLGGIDANYDDWSIGQFEKATGTHIPVGVTDPDRFNKRYTWLMANARDSWIRWRCQEEADYFGKAARILTGKRPDLRLIAVILNPHAPVPSDLKQWEAGKRQVELSREAGLDPALIAQQPGVEMIRNIGPADYRWSLSNQPKNKQALMAVRRWYFTDDQLRDYRTTSDIGVWFYYRYFETGLPANPLACSWYRDPGWLATTPAPSGDYYMEDYAHAMAVLDPALMLNGGFTLCGQGHLSQVERFARVFRQLPVGAWQEVPGLGHQVTGRTLQVGGKRYLYVVNQSSDKVDVTLPAASAGAVMQPLGGSPALSAGKVNLGPFELAAWAAGE